MRASPGIGATRGRVGSRPVRTRFGAQGASIRLADLLVQSDDDAFGPADVGESIRVLVLHQFAYQLGPVDEQARDDSVDVFDGEHDATDAQRVHRRLHGPKPDRGGRVELVELDATVAVRGPHQREGGANIVEPDQVSTEGPSTCVSPSSSRPSSMKKDLAASRSSTTMRTLSIR